MFGIILGVTARGYYAMRRCLPTNIALDAIHSRRGLKWGVPAMLIAVPYALAMVVCTVLAEDTGSGWLNLVALLFGWNSLKFLVAGPATLIALVRVRGHEERRRATAAGHLAGGEQERPEEPVLSQSRG